MKLKEPGENAPKVGGTFLSVKEVNGSIYIVDQNGEMINGLVSCSAHTSIGDYPTLELIAYSYDLEGD